MAKPANDNEPHDPNTADITPGRAKKILRLRALALEIAELSAELENDLVDKPARKRLMASVKPTPEDYAEVAAAMRRKKVNRHG